MLQLYTVLNKQKKILRNINKKTKVIISIFAGRAADAGKDLFQNLKKVFN